MPYTLKHDVQAGYIEVTLVGQVTDAEVKEATSKAISLAKDTTTTKFLCDASNADQLPSLFDLYKLPKQYKDEEASRLWPVALVVPGSEKPREAGRFYVTASKNRSWLVEAFSDLPSAIHWLSSQQVSTR